MLIFTFLVNNVYVYYPTHLICWVDTLNREFKLNYLQKFSAYLTENGLSLNYKYNYVTVV